MVLVGVSIIALSGVTAVDEVRQQNDFDSAAMSMEKLRTEMSSMAYENASSKKFRFAARNTKRVGVRQDGTLSFVINENASCVARRPVGSVEYRGDDGDVIAYQANGVWKRTDGRSVVGSAPNLEYRTERVDGVKVRTLNFPLTNVNASRSDLNGSRSSELVVRDRGGNERQEMKRDLCLAGPESHQIDHVDNVTIRIENNSFYRAWADFLRSEFGERGTITVDDSTRSVVVADVPLGLVNDQDDDTIADGNDNCPSTANPNQYDTDDDGQGDACDPDNDDDGEDDGTDNCPNVPNPDQDDADGDGRGDACSDDDDDDGVNDWTDNCQFTENENQTDVDGDGVGDACDGFNDNDSDGVRNGNDNCPNTPNNAQEDEDGDGAGDLCDPDDDDPSETGDDGGNGNGHGDNGHGNDDDCVDESNPGNSDGSQGNQCDEDADDDDGEPGNGNGNDDSADDGGGGDDGGSTDDDGDTDDDGVQDGTDNCPNTPNNDQADADGDGVGDACDDDQDGDGVQDGSDNCPTVANPDQEPVCQDPDGDGVPSADDDCPDQSGVGANGCVPVREDEDANALIVNQTEATLSVLGVQVAQKVERERTVSERKPLDVLFVLDRSGSMEGWSCTGYRYNGRCYNGEWVPPSDPDERRKSATIDFIDSLQAGKDRAGFVDFNTRAYLEHRLSGDLSSVRRSIHAEGRGGTDITSAIREANREFRQRGSSSKKVVVLLTDGRNTDRDTDNAETRAAARQAAAQGITVYAIALGEGADETLLEYVADATDGKMYDVGDADELDSVFERIAGNATSESTREIQHNSTTVSIRLGGQTTPIEANGSTDLNGPGQDGATTELTGIEPGSYLSLTSTAYACSEGDTVGQRQVDGETYNVTDCTSQADATGQVTNATSLHAIYTDGDAVPDDLGDQPSFQTGLESIVEHHDPSMIQGGEFDLDPGQAIFVLEMANSDDYAVVLFDAHDSQPPGVPGGEDDDGDSDDDGVPDDSDNCENTANHDQDDSDGDGVGDACDEDSGGDDPGNPGDDDGDDDGVPDDSDNCPDTANNGQDDSDGDGVGDACDDDGDPAGGSPPGGGSGSPNRDHDVDPDNGYVINIGGDEVVIGGDDDQ